jgi:hypothetical protein
MNGPVAVFISYASGHMYEWCARLLQHFPMWIPVHPASGISTATGITKNVTGTRKDLVDIEKGRLETAVLKEKLSPIQVATFSDVKEFDPKFHKLQQAIKKTLPPLIVILLLLGWQMLAVQNQVIGISAPTFICFLLGAILCSRWLQSLGNLFTRNIGFAWLARPTH